MVGNLGQCSPDPHPVEKSSENTLIGSAFLAFYSSGQVHTFEAIANWLSPLNTIEADIDGNNVLNENYQVFVELYQRIKNLFYRLAKIHKL